MQDLQAHTPATRRIQRQCVARPVKQPTQQQHRRTTHLLLASFSMRYTTMCYASHRRPNNTKHRHIHHTNMGHFARPPSLQQPAPHTQPLPLLFGSACAQWRSTWRKQLRLHAGTRMLHSACPCQYSAQGIAEQAPHKWQSVERRFDCIRTPREVDLSSLVAKQQLAENKNTGDMLPSPPPFACIASLLPSPTLSTPSHTGAHPCLSSLSCCSLCLPKQAHTQLDQLPCPAIALGAIPAPHKLPQAAAKGKKGPALHPHSPHCLTAIPARPPAQAAAPLQTRGRAAALAWAARSRPPQTPAPPRCWCCCWHEALAGRPRPC